jgi:MFS family permease
MRERTGRARLVTPAFLLIAGATLAFFTSAGVTLPAVPRYVAGPLRGSEVAVGFAVGLFSASALLTRPFAGRLGDTRGRRPVMVAGAAIVGASIMGYALASSVVTLTLFRLLTGVGEALFFTAATVAVVDLAPEERRGEAVSFFTLALYIGIGVGPAIGEGMIDAFGFTATWAAAAGLAGLASILAMRIPETRPERPTEPGTVRLVHPAALLPGAAFLAAVWGQAGFLAFVALYATSVGLAGSQYVFLVYSTVVVLFRWIGARIPDRIGPVLASRLALSFAVAGLSMMAVFRSPAGLLGSTVVFAVGSALAFPALVMLSLRGTDASERGAVMGTFGAFVDVGFGVGPATLGVVAHSLGYQGLFFAAAGVAASGLVLLLVAYPVRAPR